MDEIVDFVHISTKDATQHELRTRMHMDNPVVVILLSRKDTHTSSCIDEDPAGVRCYVLFHRHQ